MSKDRQGHKKMTCSQSALRHNATSNQLGIPDDLYDARIVYMKTDVVQQSPFFVIKPGLFIPVDVPQLLGAIRDSEIRSIRRMAETLEAILGDAPLPQREQLATASIRTEYLSFSSIHYPGDGMKHPVDNYLMNLSTFAFMNP